jgi:hypothetical protein
VKENQRKQKRKKKETENKHIGQLKKGKNKTSEEEE